MKKLNPRYVGPFKIIRQVNPVSYYLQLRDTYRISPTFHVKLLIPAGGPREESDLQPGPPPLIVDVEEVYSVRTLLSSRRRGT